MKKCSASNFFTSFTAEMNFGRSSSRNHCRYTLAVGAFTTIDPCTAFILGLALRTFPPLRRPEGEPSGVEPRVLMFRKRAVPPVSEIKTRNVEHEHAVVPVRASSKGFAQRLAEIVLALFGCHCDIFVFLQG
jgi:hypothetical protein